MPSVINSDDGVSSGTAGLKTSGSNDGITVFQQNGTESARITAAGNVGIGTSSPTVKLEVYDASSAVARVTAGTEIFEIRNTGSEGRLAVVSADPMTFRTSNVEAMRIASDGSVGIGNTVPNVNDQVGAARPLLVSKSDTSTTIAGSQATIVIGNADTTTNNTSQLTFAAITGANTTYFASAAINCVFGARTNGQYPTGQLVFSTSTSLNSAPTEKMRIDSSGNVGIGTSSPRDVAGYVSLGLNDTTGSLLDFYANGTRIGGITGVSGNMQVGTVTAIPLIFNTDTNERARIDSSGRLLVGTTSAPSQTGGVVVADDELFVYNIPTTASSANCHISSGESNRFYRSTSALKYKQDIRDIESIDINKFRPVRYKSKCENDDQTKDHFGVVADEVHAAGITELVSYGADGEIEGFQYERLTVVLLKAIQELKAELDATKAEVAALKAAAAK